MSKRRPCDSKEIRRRRWLEALCMGCAAVAGVSLYEFRFDPADQDHDWDRALQRLIDARDW